MRWHSALSEDLAVAGTAMTPVGPSSVPSKTRTGELDSPLNPKSVYRNIV
jgi:hypothetical protein